jgi:hypothetical protein
MRSILLALFFLAGCPREPQDPTRGDSEMCNTLADCNGGRRCGGEVLRACVDHLCEGTPSLVLPCPPDAGP